MLAHGDSSLSCIVVFTIGSFYISSFHYKAYSVGKVLLG